VPNGTSRSSVWELREIEEPAARAIRTRVVPFIDGELQGEAHTVETCRLLSETSDVHQEPEPVPGLLPHQDDAWLSLEVWWHPVADADRFDGGDHAKGWFERLASVEVGDVTADGFVQRSPMRNPGLISRPV
jgi:hypothetical protein